LISHTDFLDSLFNGVVFTFSPVFVGESNFTSDIYDELGKFYYETNSDFSLAIN
jgi:hypothetical protein